MMISRLGNSDKEAPPSPLRLPAALRRTRSGNRRILRKLGSPANDSESEIAACEPELLPDLGSSSTISGSITDKNRQVGRDSSSAATTSNTMAHWMRPVTRSGSRRHHYGSSSGSSGSSGALTVTTQREEDGSLTVTVKQAKPMSSRGGSAGRGFTTKVSGRNDNLKASDVAKSNHLQRDAAAGSRSGASSTQTARESPSRFFPGVLSRRWGTPTHHHQQQHRDYMGANSKVGGDHSGSGAAATAGDASAAKATHAASGAASTTGSQTPSSRCDTDTSNATSTVNGSFPSSRTFKIQATGPQSGALGGPWSGKHGAEDGDGGNESVKASLVPPSGVMAGGHESVAAPAVVAPQPRRNSLMQKIQHWQATMQPTRTLGGK